MILVPNALANPGRSLLIQGEEPHLFTTHVLGQFHFHAQRTDGDQLMDGLPLTADVGEVDQVKDYHDQAGDWQGIPPGLNLRPFDRWAVIYSCPGPPGQSGSLLLCKSQIPLPMSVLPRLEWVSSSSPG